jgi:hypothetical protein
VRSATFLVDPAFVASVTGGGRLSAREAVEVYARGYPARLTEALGETYEACWRVLGDESFFAVAKDFIARSPSQSYNLSDYGAGFADYLRGTAPESFDGVPPFLGDLAAFEWEFKEVFHRAPPAGLGAAELAARAAPASRLRFVPALSLLSSGHRVYGMWKRVRDDASPILDAEWTGAERLALYKKEGNPVFVRELSAPEHAALTALAAGRPLDEALASADGLDEDGARALFAFLAEERLVAEAA